MEISLQDNLTTIGGGRKMLLYKQVLKEVHYGKHSFSMRKSVRDVAANRGQTERRPVLRSAIEI